MKNEVYLIPICTGEAGQMTQAWSSRMIRKEGNDLVPRLLAAVREGEFTLFYQWLHLSCHTKIENPNFVTDKANIKDINSCQFAEKSGKNPTYTKRLKKLHAG